MRMTEKECYIYVIAGFQKWGKLEENELKQICEIIVKSKNVRKKYLDSIDKRLRISLSGFKVCNPNKTTKISEKEIYINGAEKFNKWENLTLKELKQIGDIIGNNWALKIEAVAALDSYYEDTKPELKRIK